MTVSRLSAASLLALIISACSAQTMQPHFERNAHPTDAYKLRVVFKGPPGALTPDQSSTSISYRIKNLPCAAVDEHPTHANQPIAEVPIAVTKTGENTYEGVFYRDGMQPKDYYGKGVCEWRIESPVMSFKATGKPEESEFIVALNESEIQDGFHTTVYFSRMDYPKNPDISDYAAVGTRDRSKWALKDDEIFQADVSLEKVTP